MFYFIYKINKRRENVFMKFKLGNYLKAYRAQVILGPFFKFLEAISDIMTPFLVAMILDKGIAGSDKNFVIWISVAVLAMNLAGFVFAIICQKCSAGASQGVGKDIRRDIYKKITSFSANEMDKYTTMSLTNRSVHDVSQIQSAIGMTIRKVSRAPFLLVGSAVMAMLIDIQLSCIFFVMIPLILLLFFLVMRKMNPLFLDAKMELDNVSNVTRENLSGNRVVRAFNKQQHEKDRFDVENNKFTKVNLKIGTYGSILQPLLSLIANGCIIAVVYWGGFRVNIGALTTGQTVSFINYISQLATSLVVIARMIIVYTQTGASMKRIREIFELESAIKQKENAISFTDEVEPKIEFKNVSFSYNGIKDAIKDLSIVINPGETIGVIGGTGSGKSSLVNLIPRFYDVSKGEIKIGGKSIKDYDIQSLRNYVSIVPQNPTLFSGTIESNLKFRKNDATDEDIKKALIISQSYEFVSEKPNGVKTRVERGGSNFSGGQRQRLTIARAVVGNPKILILDDSSSALDFETDYRLRKALNTTLVGTTKIYVSQRTNSIRQADKIIVLDNGNVVGIGTHEDLLKNCNVYREIYESQNS